MVGEVILVAVDASKEISDHAVEWAFQNVTKAEDFLILLAVLPSCGRPTPNLNRRRRSPACLLNLGTRHNAGNFFYHVGQVDQSKRDISRHINSVCVHKMQQLWLANNPMQVHFEVKVILDGHPGSVATKAQELKVSWVILDRLLKKEADHCIKQLNCNVVLIDHAMPRILKAVNPLAGESFSESGSQSKPTERDMHDVIPNICDYESATTLSSSDIKSSAIGTYSISLSGSDKEYQCKTINKSRACLYLNSEYFNEDFKSLETFSLPPSDIKSRHINKISSCDIDELNHKSATESSSDLLRTKSFMNHEAAESKHHFETTDKAPTLARRLTGTSCLWRGPDSPNQPKLPITRRDSVITSSKHESATVDRTLRIRKAVSLSITSPPNPPALCSICKHKTPIFRNAPRKFTYGELGKATDGFSNANFLAEGGYGRVYRGKLPDGQVIAVKQYKKLKAVEASEFCLEVEKLSCAQHRNLLMLVGYCIDTEWLLIFEFACNGSLDKHLYGTEANLVMAWHDRMKVAVGAARGLRYLNEDCRAGCIVHGDLTLGSILLTHDFEPMIGDFGLARWQLDGQLAQTHLIGTIGYLAPEYIQTGHITEKADVYAFGVILLEFLSGFRAMELSRKVGAEFLSEWGSTLLEKKKTNELIDSRLNNNYVEGEVECMIQAAYLCISPHPEQRPRMSQALFDELVLKILEGDLPLIDGASIYQRSKTFNNGSVGSVKLTKDYLKHTQHNKTNLQVNSNLDCPSDPPRCSSESEQNDMNWESESAVEFDSYLRGSLAKFVRNLN